MQTNSQLQLVKYLLHNFTCCGIHLKYLNSGKEAIIANFTDNMNGKSLRYSILHIDEVFV